MTVIKPELSIHTLVENSNLKYENSRLQLIIENAKNRIESLPNSPSFYLDPVNKFLKELRDILNGV